MILPNLGQGSGTNDLADTVSPESAEEFATHLFEKWVWPRNGKLKLTPSLSATGYDTYTQVHGNHSKAKQKRTTLVFTKEHLFVIAQTPLIVPGFAAIETSVRRRLAEQVDKNVEQLSLEYCHILNQSSKTSNATSFTYHKDDEVDEKDKSALPPAYTVIVKFTADKPLSQLSQMVVAGAGWPFSYPAAAGSGCWFHSNLWHSSVMPESSDPCLKLAFFYSVVE